MATSEKQFVWYELMTTDMDAAEAFYRAVIGWDAQAWGHPDMRYTIMSAGGKPVAGLTTISEDARAAGGRPGWLGYIYADDVDAATEALHQAGGKVQRQPADIPEVGRFSVVADPQGAMFMLFKPAGGDNPAAPPMTPGHVGWRELYASDWERAFDFYAGQFGWTKADSMDMGPMGTYQLFAAGGDPIGGMMNKPEAIPSPAWLFYFTVDAADAAAARVTGHGGQVMHGPMQVPGGSWILQGMDPQGAMFALVAPSR
jgi:predicted enzyme related to lactoylglutathione lyase